MECAAQRCVHDLVGIRSFWPRNGFFLAGDFDTDCRYLDRNDNSFPSGDWNGWACDIAYLVDSRVERRERIIVIWCTNRWRNVYGVGHRDLI